MKENNYIFNKKFGNYRTELVFPAYGALNGDLGYYWNLGISLSARNVYNDYEVHIGLIFGWFKVVKYKVKNESTKEK